MVKKGRLLEVHPDLEREELCADIWELLFTGSSRADMAKVLWYKKAAKIYQCSQLKQCRDIAPPAFRGAAWSDQEKCDFLKRDSKAL